MPAAAQDSGGAKPDVLPLAGIRVLEFCHTIMGPSAGLLLADLGAEVIKVESAPDGDTLLFANTFLATNRRCTYRSATTR